MKIWSRLSRAGMIPVVSMLCAGLAAAAPNAASGYAEITAPDDAEIVAIVPRPDAHHTTTAYAIEMAPERATHGSSGAPGATRVLGSLPAGPPIAVEIRFDPHRADNADRAAQIATAVGRLGMSVRSIGPATGPVSDGVGFVFAEDQATATELARRLAGSVGHATQMRPDARHLGETTPGTIEITLGTERGTS